MTLKDNKTLYLKAKKAYDNGGEPLMSDAQFDKLEDKIRKLDPSWSKLRTTGTRIENKKTEVKLPYFLPSLGKAYPEAIGKFFAKYQKVDKWLAMLKLDGSSLYLRYTKGKPTHLITRGDGTRGGDISFLIPALSHTLPVIKDKGDLHFRCEAIMPKSVFASKWEGKREDDKFENARNLVNGILNRKTPHPALKDVKIVVLGQFGEKLLPGLKRASINGLCTVPYHTITSDNSNADYLTTNLARSKTQAAYEADGLVLAPLNFLYEYQNSDKPKGIIAFKVNSEDMEVEAKVKDIIWQLSHNGRFTPKLLIEPIRLDGVTVTHATCHNAKWMYDRFIGPGAIVKLVRSGGVIPKIVGVVKKGKRSEPNEPHKWRGVHLVLDSKNSEAATEVTQRRIFRYLRVFEIENIALKTVQKFYDAGLTTPFHYMKAYKDKNIKPLLKAELGENTKKIFQELHKLDNVKLSTLMVASTCFPEGVGERKLSLLVDHGIDLRQLTHKEATESRIRSLLSDVPKFKDASVDMIVEGMPAFRKFLVQAEKFITVQADKKAKAKKAISGPLNGINVSFTGYRDKEQEQTIINNGGSVVTFGAQTKVLLYKEGGKLSSKLEKAKEKGMLVTTFDKFIRKIK